MSGKVVAVVLAALGMLLAGCDLQGLWQSVGGAPEGIWPATTPRPVLTSTPSVTAVPSPPATSQPTPHPTPLPAPAATPRTTPAATPVATVAPAGTASPLPSPGPSPAPPSAGGKPGPANTGVPPGTSLSVVTGDQVFSVDNQVVTGKDFHGFVRVRGGNVRFQSCVFRGGTPSGNGALLDAENAVGTVVEDSEFVAAQPAATIDGIWAKDARIVRSNIHGGVDGIKAGNNVTVQDSWIHDMNWFASDPNQSGGETHNDGVQSFDGVRGVFLLHNNIDMSTTYSTTRMRPGSRRQRTLMRRVTGWTAEAAA